MLTSRFTVPVLGLSLGLCLTLGLVANAQAQDSSSSDKKPVWAFGSGVEQSSNALGAAREWTMSLRRYTPLGSVALETLEIHRFGNTDHAWAIDAYPRLWDGAYANVRYQHSPNAELFPGHSWRAELNQSVGSGWELSASHDELGFNSHVKIETVGVVKYWGNFFFRLRHQQERSTGSLGNGDRFTVRYYYEGDGDHYVEGNVSRGRSDDFTTTLVTPSRSDSMGLAWYNMVTREWGVKTSFSESKDSSSAGGRERSWSVSLTYKW